MAANVTVTYNFTAGTPAVADDIDQNFADIVNWINTNAVHLDGSKAFTAVPSGPATDPTTANQFTRKAYVDELPSGLVAIAFPTTAQVGFGATPNDLTDFTATWTAVAGRRYKVSWAFEMTNTVAGDLVQFDLCNAANSSFMRQLIITPTTVSGTGYSRVHGFFVVTPGAGSATVKLRGYRNVGTGSFSITNSSSSGVFLVEDIGS